MLVIFFSPAATASGLASSLTSRSDAFCAVISLRKLSVSKFGSASSSRAISFSIPSISASVKPACFRACFCASVSVKASLPSTTASFFSSEASSFCEVASVSSVAVFSFVVASLVASVAVFSAAVVTTSLACSFLACSLSSLFSLITFSVVTASDCAVAVASTLLVFVVLAIELSADTWFANIIGLANTPKANKILAMLFLFFLSIKSSLNGMFPINIF